MIKKSILWCSFIMALCSFKADADCKKYFEGFWQYEDFSPKSIYVKRTLQKQFEYTDSGKYVFEFDIKWITECSYELTFVGTNLTKEAPIQVGEKLLVEIQSITPTKLSYKTRFRDMVDEGKMIKMNQQ